jgi:hypothetical protein
MFRDSMTGNAALSILEAMLMIFANFWPRPELRLPRPDLWPAAASSVPQADDALPLPVAGDDPCGKFVHRPFYARLTRLRPDEPRSEAGRPFSPATPSSM